ncbi:MAG: DUF47 domain-containing protein [Bacteroidales bacterium]|jgi:predicted phosphate transport protein (TIGR00153 family)
MKLSKLFTFLAPDEASFVQHFVDVADNLIEATELMKGLMLTESMGEREEFFDKIKNKEITGDKLTEVINFHLNKSFLTPFDREDIHELTYKLEDVLNNLYAASQRIKLYKPAKLSKEMVLVTEIIGLIAIEIREAVRLLDHAISHREGIIKACDKIDILENKADHLHSMGISKLFDEENDITELIKVKEILASLEKAADRSEQVSDVIRTILLKMA